MKYLEMKSGKGPAQNKALSGPAANKSDIEPVAVMNDGEPEADAADALEGVQFASPAARAAAQAANLTADAFRRKKKSGAHGFTSADVERIAAANAPETDEEDGA